jgi:hypothetical protein
VVSGMCQQSNPILALARHLSNKVPATSTLQGAIQACNDLKHAAGLNRLQVYLHRGSPGPCPGS